MYCKAPNIYHYRVRLLGLKYKRKESNSKDLLGGSTSRLKYHIRSSSYSM